MTNQSREKLKQEIYRIIMRWLEGRLPDGRTQVLVIPVRIGAEERNLRFRRGVGMGERKWAESIDQPVRIEYDPNWEALDHIDALIGTEPPAVVAEQVEAPSADAPARL